MTTYNNLFRYITLLLWGGAIYWLIEMLWRGIIHGTPASHWSMFILGGICFVIIGGLNRWFSWNLGIVWQALIGAAVITVLELIAGLIVNTWLGWDIWDYSDLPFNIFGQISLLYSLFWIPLAAVGVFLDDYLRHKIFGEQKPKYTLF